MRRFILSLVALVVTAVCFAQDIIVQKDGSTIKAKVIKVSQSEVEYKKFDNQNGPTYTISTKDLQCINYENGSKDTFVSPGYNPSTVTNGTATQFSNDDKLNQIISAHKRKTGKTIKTIGWIVGGAIFLGGTITAIAGSSNGSNEWDSWGKKGIPVAVVGAGTCAICYFVGQHKINNSDMSVLSTSIYQQEFNISKTDRFMVGIDVLRDNTYKNHTLGLGVSYNF